MTTKANSDFPEIEWEMGEQLEYDPEERMRVFNGIGIDKDGNKYSGAIKYVCGELEAVEDIEPIKE